jgi:hypothetical protein
MPPLTATCRAHRMTSGRYPAREKYLAYMRASANHSAATRPLRMEAYPDSASFVDLQHETDRNLRNDPTLHKARCHTVEAFAHARAASRDVPLCVAALGPDSVPCRGLTRSAKCRLHFPMRSPLLAADPPSWL